MDYNIYIYPTWYVLSYNMQYYAVDKVYTNGANGSMAYRGIYNVF